MSAPKKREGFSSGVAVFFATLGSAVGLGNIWKFPTMTGTNGGGAFVMLYLLCVLFVGIPVMICEFYVGRRTHSNAIGAFKKLNAPAWSVIGYFGVASSLLIMFFYSCVAGWVYYYFVKAATGQFVGITLEAAKAQFGSAVTGTLSPLIWQWIVLAVVGTVLIMGVRNGIERVTKTLMPLLFILILICDIRSVTLPHSGTGLYFLFHVDFSKITPAVILAALGLAFFKLSLGMGIMVTYGSYFTDDNHLFQTAGRVAVTDTIISLLAGIAIFPAVFSFGMEPSAGPGLLFMTIPLVFSKMPMGMVLLAAFFLLTCFCATTAMISLVEVPTAWLSEEWGLKRPTAVVLVCLFIAAVGATASLSVDSSSLLGQVKVFGKSFFDLYDYLSSNLLMPIGGLLLTLFVGYINKKQDVLYELSNHGLLKNDSTVNYFWLVTRYLTPALLIIIFLNCIGVIHV